MTALSTLRLEPATLTRSVEDGDVTLHPKSHFLDLVVDDVSLLATVRGPDGWVSELNRPWLEQVPEAIDSLLGRRPRADLRSGRVPLLVCGECGDPACGAFTTALHFDLTHVTWREFLWEDGIQAPGQVTDFPKLLRFDRVQYEAAFADAYDRVANLSYDPIARNRRPFLWPWQWGWRLPRTTHRQ